TVSIFVIPVNDPPVAAPDQYAVNEDGALNVSGPGVLANDTDVDGDRPAAILVAGPSHGTVSLNGDGSFRYVPTLYYRGPDSFLYQATDGFLRSGVATVSVTVNPVNHAPMANADHYVTDEDLPLTVTAANGVLANDIDVDGDLLEALLVMGPAHGVL